MNKPNLDGICVLVDGGCLNNNKPVSERSMYGSLMVYYNGQPVNFTLYDKEYHYGDQGGRRCTIPSVDGWASNNLAELEMVSEALDYVTGLERRAQAKGSTLPVVTIMSDSEFALGMASGAMKVGKKTDQSIADIVTEIRVKVSKCSAIFQHVDNVWVKSVLGH